MNKLKFFTLCLALFGFSSFAESPGISIDGILNSLNALDKQGHDLYHRHTGEDGEVDVDLLDVIDKLEEATPEERVAIKQNALCLHQKSLISRYDYECFDIPCMSW